MLSDHVSSPWVAFATSTEFQGTLHITVGIELSSWPEHAFTK